MEESKKEELVWYITIACAFFIAIVLGSLMEFEMNNPGGLGTIFKKGEVKDAPTFGFNFYDYHRVLKKRGWKVMLHEELFNGNILVSATRATGHIKGVSDEAPTPTRAIKKVYDYIVEKGL